MCEIKWEVFEKSVHKLEKCTQNFYPCVENCFMTECNIFQHLFIEISYLCTATQYPIFICAYLKIPF